MTFSVLLLSADEADNETFINTTPFFLNYFLGRVDVPCESAAAKCPSLQIWPHKEPFITRLGSGKVSVIRSEGTDSKSWVWFETLVSPLKLIQPKVGKQCDA